MPPSPKAASVSKLTLQRWYLIGGIAFLFCFAAFVNVSFFVTNSASDLPHIRAEHHGSVDHFLQHVVFTATCSERDVMRANVLAFSAREQRFTGDLTYVAYNCDKTTFTALASKIPAAYNVSFFHAVDVQGSGDKELNPHALHAWISTYAPRVKPEEFVMIVEIDTIFTRTLDIVAMLKVADTMKNPTMLAQDAAWYDSDTPDYIMPPEILEKALGPTSRASKVEFWRGNAVHAPFVMQSRHLDATFAKTKTIYSKLDQKYQHLAYPLACAELGLEHGVAGNFRLSRYNSFAENWNVVDMIQYNPINESITTDSPLYGEYPFTMRTNTLELTKWVDGAKYVMRDLWIPLDFFHCDASLLEVPPPSLWHYAKHTYGWEQLSPILRTRHIMSISLALRAYNRAALDIKQRNCPHGFNANQEILLRENLASAVSSNLPLHGLPTEAPQEEPFHFVFTSTCSNSDQWQADMLVESFIRINQPGSLTRIVVGCESKAQMDQVILRTQTNTRLHFASEKVKFQTHAIRHWLQETNLPHLPSRLVILSLDFLFLRQFSMNKTKPVITAYQKAEEDPHPELMEVIHGSRRPKEVHFYSGSQILQTIETKPGTIIAQNFNDYLKDLTQDSVINSLCPDCPKVEAPKTVAEVYNIGLPYVLATSDLQKSIGDACTITEKYYAAHSPTKRSQADLVGFSMAAAKNGLNTIRLDNMAITRAASEDWNFALAKKEINSFTTIYVLANPCASDIVAPPTAAPFLRQYTRYQVNKWLADPALMPENIFACDMWLLKEPPASLWDDAINAEDPEKIKNTYGLCTTIKLWNALLIQSRMQHCPNGFNSHKRLELVDPRPDAVVASLKKWP
ncbi:hypothetical protein AC1031_016745 [Aphanomyces cochlioides]|nr:hypothetical protein AC1031_016745 [Aphanomyces cochlioides]